MLRNIGKFDGTLRLLLATAALALYFSGAVGGKAGIALVAAAAALLLTGFVRVCPLYLPFGIRTDRKDAKEETGACCG